MRALVTGASGFVGQWLCSALIRRGDSVTGTAMDVDVDGIPPVREELRRTVEWIRVDLRQPEEIATVVDRARPDVVFHLAGVTFVPAATADPGQAYDVNVVATARLLGELGARKRGGTLDPVVVVVGSGEQYGRHDSGKPLPETAPQHPLSVYGATKMAQEVAALQSWRGTGLRVICSRSFNHTGPGQADHMLIPALVRRALALRGTASPRLRIGNTTPVRDFLHVEDVVQAYLLLAERGIVGEAYNVSSGVGRSVGELVSLVLARVDVTAELEPAAEYIRPVDLPVLVGDPTKLRVATGWRPQSGLEHAIDQLIDAASQ